MPPRRAQGWAERAEVRLREARTERRELHGLRVSVVRDETYTDAAPLWAKVGEALDLVAAHRPVWIRSMRRLGVETVVERTPGTRARLVEGKTSILDAYFVAEFLPAQIASSIVHEATHARVRSRGIPNQPATIAREERLCRASELRLGRAMLAAGVPGADAVLARAEESLALPDEQVAPAVDWRALRTASELARLDALGLPRWLTRWIARRRG
ncbi:MAG TPA: hypothetical protein VNP72_10025 [Longimicrobium sp.]|nr:hypothetical protein [Longimicrobium sp.]